MELMRQESTEQKTWVWSKGRPLCSQVDLVILRSGSANRNRPVEEEGRRRLEAAAERHGGRERRQRATDIEVGASEDPSSWAKDDGLWSIVSEERQDEGLLYSKLVACRCTPYLMVKTEKWRWKLMKPKTLLSLQRIR